MKIARRLLFLIVFSFFGILYAQVQKFDLSNINTIKEAKSYYEISIWGLCQDNVSRETVIEVIHKLYALSERLCMRSMDDINDIDKYSCKISASNFDEEIALKNLRRCVSEKYRCIQQLVSPFGKAVVHGQVWQDFLMYYDGCYKHISYEFVGKILWYETDFKGIKFVEFHNLDDDFAYDIKVYHNVNPQETLVREYTLMPRKVKVITSSVDGSKIYFYPSNIEIVNKYYVGAK